MLHIETERKFLVQGDYKTHASRSYRISQGYLSSVPERTVRVRVRDEKGYLTIKGKGNGVSRVEWETEIPQEDAVVLLGLCEQGVIDKTRHIVEYAGHVFEVDEFHGENEGLILAELELGSEDEAFDKPDWLGEEVTGDVRYYNSYLTSHPFRHW